MAPECRWLLRRPGRRKRFVFFGPLGMCGTAERRPFKNVSHDAERLMLMSEERARCRRTESADQTASMPLVAHQRRLCHYAHLYHYVRFCLVAAAPAQSAQETDFCRGLPRPSGSIAGGSLRRFSGPGGCRRLSPGFHRCRFPRQPKFRAAPPGGHDGPVPVSVYYVQA